MNIFLINSGLTFLKKEVRKVVVDVDSLEELTGYFINSSSTYASGNSMFKIPVPSGFNKVTIVAKSGTSIYASILANEDTGREDIPSFCAYSSKRRFTIDGSKSIMLQEDAKYIYVNNTTGNNIYSVVFEEYFETPFDVNFENAEFTFGYISITGLFNMTTAANCLFLNPSGFSKIKIYGSQNNNSYVGFLRSIVTPVSGEKAPMCGDVLPLRVDAGTSSVEIDIPSDCKAIYVSFKNSPTSVVSPDRVVLM